MQIPVAFKNGKERSVSKDELEFLMETEQIMFFKRSDGWVVIGRDKLRSQSTPYSGEDRR